jgi:hypothetical protein
MEGWKGRGTTGRAGRGGGGARRRVCMQHTGISSRAWPTCCEVKRAYQAPQIEPPRSHSVRAAAALICNGEQRRRPRGARRLPAGVPPALSEPRTVRTWPPPNQPAHPSAHTAPSPLALTLLPHACGACVPLSLSLSHTHTLSLSLSLTLGLPLCTRVKEGATEKLQPPMETISPPGRLLFSCHSISQHRVLIVVRGYVNHALLAA